MDPRPAMLLVAVLLGVGGCAHEVPPSGERVAGEAPVTPAAPGWRTEYWHDVAVDVPADWWYGGGPMRAGRDVLACYPEPIVDPTGERREGRGAEATGWVGRPLLLTDVCLDPDAGGPPPEGPYLWFDAPLPVGLEDLGDGLIRETVEVSGARITVATGDDRLRERILATATGGETCFSELEGLDDPAAPPPPTIEGDRPTVCAYRETGGEARLSYAAELPTSRGARFVAAVESAPAAADPGRRGCNRSGTDFEWAVLQVGGETYVVRTGSHCPHVQVGDRFVRLTPAVVEPWAYGGIAAVMVGPTGGKGAMLDGFIGVQG